MRHPLLATRVYNCPLMLAPGKAEIIERWFRALTDGESALLSPQVDAPKVRAMLPGSTRTEGGYERTADGVAIIQMLGPLVQRGGMNFPSGGPTGYNEVAAELHAALGDPRVGAILLEIDSPGGEANGAFELQTKIRAAGSKKPTWAIAAEQAFSAAYLQAAGAEKLFVPESGMVGSVGVVMLHLDQSQSDARRGLVYTPIFAGARKVDFSSHAPLSDDAMQVAQEEVDRVYGLFVEAVAQGRKVDAQVVRDTEAALLHPAAALKAGLIDGIQSFDETLAQLTAEAQHIRIYGTRAAASMRAITPTAANSSSEGETEMTDKELEAKLAAARAEGVTEGRAAATTEAATASTAAAKTATEAERARVSAILTHAEAEGRSKLANHLAFKTTHSVEDAVAMLAAADKAATAPANPLAEAMGKVPNPNVTAGAGDAADPAPKRIKSAAEIYDFRQKCVANAMPK